MLIIAVLSRQASWEKDWKASISSWIKLIGVIFSTYSMLINQGQLNSRNWRIFSSYKLQASSILLLMKSKNNLSQSNKMKEIMTTRNKTKKKNNKKISSKTMKSNNRSNNKNRRINNNSLKVSHKLNLNHPKEVIISFYPNSNAHSIKNKIHNSKAESLNWMDKSKYKCQEYKSRKIIQENSIWDSLLTSKKQSSSSTYNFLN